MPLFVPITKVDVAKRLVYGTLSEEIADKSGEILDYETSKPAFQEWSQQFADASGGKSLGNVRAMHGNIAAGKLIDIVFDDEHKRIEGVAKVVDEDAWNKVVEGVYTGFSIGGGYQRRWPDPVNAALMRYTPTLSEVSLVDNPAVPTATFSLVKQDGTIEVRNFSESEATGSPIPQTLAEQLELLLESVGPGDEVAGNIEAVLRYLRGEKVTAEEPLVEKLHQAPLENYLQLIEVLAKRVSALESMPMPPRGLLRAVTKSQDYRLEEDPCEMEAMSGMQRVQELMKRALANPQVM